MRKSRPTTKNSNIRGLPFRHHGVLDVVDVPAFDEEEHFFMSEIDLDNSALHVWSSFIGLYFVGSNPSLQLTRVAPPRPRRKKVGSAV
jgi:hypothetical protein